MAEERYRPVRLKSEEAVAKAMKRPGFSKAWEQLDPEYIALSALLSAREAAGLSQADVALRMGTSKSAVSRLEASFHKEASSPSFATLKRYAQACGRKLVIQLV